MKAIDTATEFIFLLICGLLVVWVLNFYGCF